MNLFIVILLCILPMALFIAYMFRVSERDRTQTAKLLDRIRANPKELSEVQLSTGNPMTVKVRLEGDPAWHSLSGIHDVAAVRLFDALKAAAPAADAYEACNGRRMDPAEFDRIASLQHPYPN
jgi:hypothetical protein